MGRVSRCVRGFENAYEAVRTSHDVVVWPRAARRLCARQLSCPPRLTHQRRARPQVLRCAPCLHRTLKDPLPSIEMRNVRKTVRMPRDDVARSRAAPEPRVRHLGSRSPAPRRRLARPQVARRDRRGLHAVTASLSAHASLSVRRSRAWRPARTPRRVRVLRRARAMPRMQPISARHFVQLKLSPAGPTSCASPASTSLPTRRAHLSRKDFLSGAVAGLMCSQTRERVGVATPRPGSAAIGCFAYPE